MSNQIKMRLSDRYFYNPNLYLKILAFVLLPLSIIYGIMAYLRRKISLQYDFQIPIISIGNLVSGGSGKTPFIIELAKYHKDIAIISRGYKRQSRGLVVVSLKDEILVSVEDAGDEPYLIAKSVAKYQNNSCVIVSKDRIQAIKKAKELGYKIVFLDDGFRFNFKKLNILLKPKLKPYFPFVLPSGIYREFPLFYANADILIEEGIEYKRVVKTQNPTEKMLLLSAIANPSRLLDFIEHKDKICAIYVLPDHSNFDKDKIDQEMKRCGATSLLVTSKDLVKLEKFDFKISILRLDLEIDSNILTQIDRYIKESNE